MTLQVWSLTEVPWVDPDILFIRSFAFAVSFVVLLFLGRGGVGPATGLYLLRGYPSNHGHHEQEILGTMTSSVCGLGL